jgi:rubrerythrin
VRGSIIARRPGSGLRRLDPVAGVWEVDEACDMSDKPSYLGLLNAISNAESDAECYLDAWAKATPRDDVRQIISTVALREGEHGKAFAKRICELGYSVVPRVDEAVKEKMAIASSTTLTDREKFEKLDIARPVDPSKPDFFTNMFADTTIDIQTGQLLGRYIAEERDSGRMLRACYSQLCAEEEGRSSNGGATEARLARVEALLEELVAKVSSGKSK